MTLEPGTAGQLRAADSSANNVSVVKEALAQLGLCRPDVRPPSHRVGDEARTQIAEILAGWGLAGWGPR